MRIFVPQKPFLWAVLGALAYVLCFPKINFFWLAFVPMPFWLLAVERLRSRADAVICAYIVSAIIGVGGFHWITHVMQEFGQMSAPLALFFLFLFTLIASPQAYLFFLIGHSSREGMNKFSPLVQIVYWSSLYTACEYLARFTKIFPEHLGNTTIGWPVIAQNAAWGGVSSLTFLWIFTGASLFYAIRTLRWNLLVPTLLLWGLYSGLGARSLHKWRHLATKDIRIGVVQANIGDSDKVAGESGDVTAIDIIIERYLTLSDQAAKAGAELIVWPETAYPVIFPGRGYDYSPRTFLYADKVKKRVMDWKVPLALGGYERENRTTYNSVVVVNSEGTYDQAYRKVKLLIFGESMPFSDWFPALKSLNPILGDFGRGQGPLPVTLRLSTGEAVTTGFNICYEAILPEFMRELARNGAQFFLNVTNDSWFGDTAEPWQHLQLAQLRAIEHRLPFLRSTNTGLSVLVDPTGVIREQGPLFSPMAAVWSVPLPVQIPRATLYTKYGEWFVRLMMVFLVWCYWLQRRRLTR